MSSHTRRRVNPDAIDPRAGWPDHTPILCPHGKATSWTGTTRYGDPLPECEHCEACNPGAVELDRGDIGLSLLFRIVALVCFLIVLAIGAGWVTSPVIFAWLGAGLAAWVLASLVP